MLPHITARHIYERGITERLEAKNTHSCLQLCERGVSHEMLPSSCLSDLSRVFFKNSTLKLQTETHPRLGVVLLDFNELQQQKLATEFLI